ncbi:hypothetical protein BDN72DRAFT_261522 [Pluteus cervinus]|uniref:Uncharacterized protein n=1 Tax=Pluteus cervinus TaxID=181527 RepID=A0ACD3AFW5_9AGAR|nr:hypothetical protein BDN72DRAFT_261522 [Pluteus cervinus]
MSSETATTASPMPISPFTTHTTPSEATSEEMPNLGAFTTVLRAWSHLQPQPRFHQPVFSTTSSSTATQSITTSNLPTELDDNTASTDFLNPSAASFQRSTVWTHGPIASYLALHTPAATPLSVADSSPSLSPSFHSSELSAPWQSAEERLVDEPDTEAERTVEILSSELDGIEGNDTEDILAQDAPSLGYLDEALSFIAAERARMAALREAAAKQILKAIQPQDDEAITLTSMTGSGSISSITFSSHKLAASSLSASTIPQNFSSSPSDDDDDIDDDNDIEDPDASDPPGRILTVHAYKSTPSTPHPGRAVSSRKRVKRGLGLAHARSDPSLRENAGIDTASVITSSSKVTSRGSKDTVALGKHQKHKSQGSGSPLKVKSSKSKKAESDMTPSGQETPTALSGLPWPSFATHPRPTFLSALPTSPRLLVHPHADARKQSPDPRRRKLENLLRKLVHIFPEDKGDLDRVAQRLSDSSSISRSTSGSSSDSRRIGDNSDADLELDEVVVDFDSRRRAVRDGESLIHVFIDHSNILIGLLSYIKRHPSLVSAARPLPPIPPSSTGPSILSPRGKHGAKGGDEERDKSGKLNDGQGKNGSGKKSGTGGVTLIGNNENKPIAGAGSELGSVGSGGGVFSHGGLIGGASAEKKPSQQVVQKKQGGRKMWHAALALILERGRPVNRRVLVASSPLYQPVDAMERMGYEVRVYLRVPDMGDGMDRDKQRFRAGLPVISAPTTTTGTTTGNGGTISMTTTPKKRKQGGGHSRKQSASASGNNGTGTESDVATGGGGGSGNGSSGTGASGKRAGMLIPSANSKRHSGQPSTTTTGTEGYHISSSFPGATGIGSSPAQPQQAQQQQRIKYREQGVDELLQLKLHQAIAATDEVPNGATIVLATGDGNVGQFDEDGFLGPVRTALRKGWKVELYAWEGGLSRAWKREFGEGSEWWQKGMFRIIGMEQFASALVEEF